MSPEPSLDDHGAGFADHIANLWPDEPDMGELAELDWAMRRVFDGEDAQAFDPSVLRALSGDLWDRLGSVFHQTLTVRMVTTNAGALWSGLCEGSPLMPAPLSASMAVRVWRKYLQPHFRMIDECIAARVERAAALLAVWLEDGLIVGLTNA